ncbi:MAG: hypothetical protein WA741_23380, partial [Candidatus Sulfotelmatobacter sp.]
INPGQPGNNGAVWSASWEPSSGWLPWFLVSNEVNMQPGATVTALWRPNQMHLDLFATGNDGAVWSASWEPSRGWWPWFLVNNQVKMQPGATVSALWRPGDTHLDLFATGDDGAVWSASWEPSSGWSSWFLVHNEVKMPPGATVTALLRPSQTHLDLFTTGKSGAEAGQVSAIAVDLNNDSSGNTVYVGTSSGGLWKSTNGLSSFATFTLLSDQSQSLSIGALAVDTKSGASNVYVGTGAPDNSSNVSAYTGTGILISRDGGQTWPEHVYGTSDNQHSFVGLGFSNIRVDPNNSNIILASTGSASDYNFAPATAVQNYRPLKDIGIYRSTDYGRTWSQVYSVPPLSVGCSCSADAFSAHVDLAYDSTTGHYYAGIAGQGVLVSDTQGASWSATTPAIPGLTASQFVRVDLATRNGSLYALIMATVFPPKPPNPNVDDGDFQLWQYSSGTGGQQWAWSSIGMQSRGLPTGNQLFKGFLNYVAAPPNSTKLIAATQFPYVIDLGNPSATWQAISPNETDQHVVAFADATHWYLGNDHGVYVTNNEGGSWMSVNGSIHASEVFSAAPDLFGSGNLAVTTQDNANAVGSDSTLNNVNPPGNGNGCGEGGYAFADPNDATAFFTSGNWGCLFYAKTATPPNTPITYANFSSVVQNDSPAFTAPFEILSSDSRLYSGATGFGSFDFTNARFFLGGGQNPWILAFNPADQTSVTKQLASLNSPISYIRTVPGNPTSAYLVVGNSSSPGIAPAPTALYRMDNISFNGGATLTSITGGPIDGSNLGPVAVSPQDSNTIYLVKAGFQAGQKVFKRTVDATGNQSWTNISGAALPNVPVNAIVVDGAHPSNVYIGTNVGAWDITDGGVLNDIWQPIGSGLPNVPVMQLNISFNRALVAATWGRGVWTFSLPQ